MGDTRYPGRGLKPAPMVAGSDSATIDASWVPGVATCIAAAALSDLNMGLLAPFFPETCAHRGVPHALVGSMFSALPIAAVVATPAAPLFIRLVGCRRVLLLTLVLQGLLSLAFASLSFIQGRAAFIAVGMSLRAMQGLGGGIFETALLSLLMRSVPEKLVGSVVGWSEAGRACGFLLGPVLGGALYEVGGFALPFFVVGGALLTLPAALMLVMRRADSASNELQSVQAEEPSDTPPVVSTLALLQIPAVSAGLLVQLAIFAVISFFDPTLQPFLALPPLALSAGTVGLLLGLAVLFYVLFSIVSGPLAGVTGDVACLHAGLIVAAAAIVLIGPSPLLPDMPAHSLPLVLGVMASLGAGAGLTVAPVTNLMVRAASSGGLTMQHASDQLATISTLSYACGAATGPLAGGAAVQLLGGPYDGFRRATTGLGLGLLGLLVVLEPVFCRERCRAPRAAVEDGTTTLPVVPQQTSISDPLLTPGAGARANQPPFETPQST